MNIQIFGKPKCFDTKKAERFFKERGIKYQYIDLKSKGFSRGELESVVKAAGGLDEIIDKASKSQGAVLIKYLSGDDAKFEKLLEDGTLIRTPVVRNGKKAAVGYQPDIWEKWTKE